MRTTRSSRRIAPTSSVSNAHFATNLFLGTDTTTGIASLGGPTALLDVIYDGFRPNRGAEFQYSWSGPREGMR